jgi:membrane associated rhomboid family serine protease
MQTAIYFVAGVLAVAALVLFLAGISVIAAGVIGGVALAALIGWIAIT